MNSNGWATQLILISVPLLAATLANGQHTGDVWVGVTAQSQLAISTNGYVPELNFAPLAPAGGAIQGWSDDDPGFDHAVAANDLSSLESGAEIWLEVVGVDAAFRAIDDGFQILDDPGDDTFLGGASLHEHFTWNINNQDPAFEDDQCVWRATFVLRDDGTTLYATSEPFTFSFTNVSVRASGVPADGDFDGSGSAEFGDAPALVECTSGPGVMPDPDDPDVTTCEVECLNAFDFDDDRDIDLKDYAAFQVEASD